MDELVLLAIFGTPILAAVLAFVAFILIVLRARQLADLRNWKHVAIVLCVPIIVGLSSAVIFPIIILSILGGFSPFIWLMLVFATGLLGFALSGFFIVQKTDRAVTQLFSP